MSRPATSRLKVNPPVGIRPSLENRRIGELNIDPTYQRAIDNASSTSLIRRIAMFWDWSLFQPLVVSRREDGAFFVVDGQHRLAAARLRNDMYDLPCVITAYASAGDEAAAFVALNQQRRPLSVLDVFRASIEAGDIEAMTITAIMTAAGATLAPHTNFRNWKSGMVANIGGIRAAYRQFGRDPVSAALVALTSAYAGQVLQYAGTLFMPLARFYAAHLPDADFDPDLFVEIVSGATQRQWVDEILLEKAAAGGQLAAAGERALTAAYDEAFGEAIAA